MAERLQIVVSQAVLFTVSMEGSAYALEDFAVSELVLVKNVNRKEPWWPVGLEAFYAAEGSLAKPLCSNSTFTCDFLSQAIVLDPIKEAPETIRRQMQPERLCVMFYGPPANKVGKLGSVYTLNCSACHEEVCSGLSLSLYGHTCRLASDIVA